MNYRHAFHAGNFADVLKHAVLARILVHLGRKDTPFHVIDTHAGIGLYDLYGNEAGRTGEWRDGIGRLANAAVTQEARNLLAPWSDIVAAVNQEAGHQDPAMPRYYPGSPLIAARLMRRGDRLSACEMHPDDHALLAEALAGDRQAKIYDLDGWLAVKSFLPPKERRGVVLIDPPFEQAGEFARLVAALEAGRRRFANGIYMLWYPIKNAAEASAFHADLIATGARRILALELAVAPVREGQGLTATGLVIVNPPWPLADECRVLLPELARLLARAPGGGARILELAGE